MLAKGRGEKEEGDYKKFFFGLVLLALTSQVRAGVVFENVIHGGPGCTQSAGLTGAITD